MSPVPGINNNGNHHNMNTMHLQNHNSYHDNQHHHTNYPTLPMMIIPTNNSIKQEDDDFDFQDNASEASCRSGNGGSKSKVFQCTGYGECSMVFTRSEHLARHMRKHTGEKPFKCVVPGCERMFSRFDNMMQHTQTHNKNRNNGQRRNSTKAKSKRGSNKKSNIGRRAVSSSDDYDDDILLPSPPPSRRGSNHINTQKEHQIMLPNPKYLEIDEDDIIDEYDHDYSNKYSKLPDSPVLSDYSANNEYHLPRSYSHPIINRRRSAPKVHYQPYPTSILKSQPEVMPIIPRHHSALSQLANYLVNNPDQSPESYLSQKEQEEKPTVTRRLSIQDLSNPLVDEKASSTSSIDTVKKAQSKDDKEEEGVDITEDEFQAIQGFGQFYRSAITCNK